MNNHHRLANFAVGSLITAGLFYGFSSISCLAQDMVPVPTGGVTPIEPSGGYTQTTTVEHETVKPHHHHGLIPETVGVTGKAVKETVGLPGKAVKETFKALF